MADSVEYLDKKFKAEIENMKPINQLLPFQSQTTDILLNEIEPKCSLCKKTTIGFGQIVDYPKCVEIRMWGYCRACNTRERFLIRHYEDGRVVFRTGAGWLETKQQSRFGYWISTTLKKLFGV